MPNRRPTPTIRYPLGKLRRSSRLSGEKITNDDDDGALVVVLSKDTISGAGAGAGAGAGSLDYLRNSPKFQALRTMVQSNPHILQPILQELGKKDRGLLRRVEEHYSEFLQLINEPMDGTEGSANNNTYPAVVATTDYDKAEDINGVVNPNVDKMDEDAGKSTTGGQILFLSDQVDDRTIQKYEKEAKDKS